MKKQLLLTGLLAVTLNSFALAESKCAEGTGNMVAGKITVACLKIAGAAKMDGTTVTDSLRIAGSLNGTSVKLNSLQVAGKVKLTDSVVSGPVKITGALDAKNTTFLDKVVLSTKTATFSHSTVKSIEITSENPTEKATIYLEDNSFVNGDITFTNGNGIVKNSHSKISGKVIGGKVE